MTVREVAAFQRILVATDFSPQADRALERALLLPLDRRAAVTILHVLPERLRADLRARAKTRAARRLRALVARSKRALRRVDRRAVRVTPEVTSGRRFTDIIRRARGTGSELIVLGRHGAGRGRGGGVGSTAVRVIRHGVGPVLIVSRVPARPYRRVLVALDLDDTARHTLVLGRRLAGTSAEGIVVLHSIQVPFEGFLEPVMTAREIRDYRKRSSVRAATRLTTCIEGTGLPPTTFNPVVRSGDPRTTILHEASRRASDLVVIGTHGRSGLRQMLLGSVAESVLQSLGRDLLIARPARKTFPLL